MKRSLSKKSKKVIEENLEEFKAMPLDEDRSENDVTGGLRGRNNGEP